MVFGCARREGVDGSLGDYSPRVRLPRALDTRLLRLDEENLRDVIKPDGDEKKRHSKDDGGAENLNARDPELGSF